MTTRAALESAVRDPLSSTSLMGLKSTDFNRKIKAHTRKSVASLKSRIDPRILRRLTTDPLAPKKKFAVTPDINSIEDGAISSKYETFITDLYETLTSELPPDKFGSNNLIEGNAIQGDWTRLFTVPGLPSSTPPYAMGDNTHRVRRDPTPEELEMLNIMGEIVAECSIQGATFVTKNSSGGMPGTDDGATNKINKMIFMAQNSDPVLDTFCSDPMEAITRHKFSAITTNAIRYQADAVDPATWKSKRRPDRDPAINFSVPDAVEGDMIKDIPGSMMKMQRNRAAYAVPQSINATLSVIGQAAQNGLYANFPETFNSDPVKVAVLHDPRSYGVDSLAYASGDAREYDSTQSLKAIFAFYDGWSKAIKENKQIFMYWAPRLQILNRAMGGNPIIAYGDLTNPFEYLLKCGNPSGGALNVTQNKALGAIDLFMTAVLVDPWLKKQKARAQTRATKKELLKYFLSHHEEMHQRQTTSGDDFTGSYLTAELRDNFMKVHSERSMYWVTMEPAKVYHGSLFVSKDGILQAIPDIRAYLTNFYVPEREAVLAQPGKKNPFRSYPAFGYHERMAHFAKAPAYDKVREIEDSIVAKHYGRTTTEAFKPWLEQEILAMRFMASDIDYENLDAASRAVMHNPDYIHYRYKPSEIDPRLLAAIQATTTPEQAALINSCIFI